MKGTISVNVNLRIGKYTVRHKVRIPTDVIYRFAEVCGECNPDDFNDVKKHFARTLEDTINAFIARAYKANDTPDRILARAVVYLATELVLVEEALNNAEGGKIL